MGINPGNHPATSVATASVAQMCGSWPGPLMAGVFAVGVQQDAERMSSNPMRPENGEIAIPEGPGLGVTLTRTPCSGSGSTNNGLVMTSIDTPCDLAIIGGGLAGLTAGIAASERGLRVAIFERGADERYPCNSRFAGGAFHVACRTDPTSEPDDLLAAINRVTKDEADPALARVMKMPAAPSIGCVMA